jgi:two-component system NtrC family sensor kinase
MKLSLRSRLLGSFVLVILVCGATATVVGVSMIGEGIIKQAQDKVRHDLNFARYVYDSAGRGVQDAVHHTAVRFFIERALQAGQVDPLAAELEAIRRREALDILTLTDNHGKVLLRARNPRLKGDSQAADPIVKTALGERRAVVATEMVARDELLKEAEELAERARMEFVPTQKAKATSRTEETSGMMIKAAAPVMGEHAELLGVLYGGKLLNRNYDLVDEIKQMAYHGEVYGGREMGTATIFEEDLRISTNVLTEKGERAIGTRVSEEVHRRVLIERKPWVERAFVVNDWYISAYEPIKDISGDIIGVLSVGMLESKFTDMRWRALWAFMGISLGGGALAAVICLFLARTLASPVKTLAVAAERFAKGNLKQRVKPDESTREIGMLGRAFNSMASSIEERDEQLRQRAQEEITKSGRLAMIGQLAAGVAHEINNPLGGILLFSNLLLGKAASEGVERENLERIAREAERCRKIVQGLLEFSRQREPEAKAVNIRDVVEKAIALLGNQALFHNIVIVRAFQPDLPAVCVDASQMQQVFVNIMMNAADAMNGKGDLRISAKGDRRAERVDVSFTDSGCGIPEEALEHLFEPFFTTKEVGHGTGLGLSISHGIVERHGGSMKINSKVGQGTTVTVSLPSTASLPESGSPVSSSG